MPVEVPVEENNSPIELHLPAEAKEKRAIVIGVRAGGRGGLQPPQLQKFLKFLGQKYSGENNLENGQSQTSRLLSLTFALSRRS